MNNEFLSLIHLFRRTFCLVTEHCMLHPALYSERTADVSVLIVHKYCTTAAERQLPLGSGCPNGQK